MRSASLTILRAGALSVGLAGCGAGSDVWGVLHGDVSVRSDGAVEGFLVWEFFEARWERSLSEEEHRCARVLEVSGPPAACEGCAAAAVLVVNEVEHDCPGAEGTQPQLRSMDFLQIAPTGKAPAGAWPDDQWSWALGWDGGAAQPEGVAWDEGFEFGEPPADPGVLAGRRVRLGSATARRFSEKELLAERATDAPEQ